MLIASLVGSIVAAVTWTRRRKAVKRGRAVMSRVEDGRAGFGSLRGRIEIDCGGGVPRAQVDVRRVESPGLGTRSTLRMLYPTELADLEWRADGENPAFYRSRFQEPAVLGTLLLCRDLAPETDRAFVPHFVRRDVRDGVEYLVVDRHPSVKSPHFKKVRTWIEARRHVVCREEYLGRKNRVLAEREFSDWLELPSGGYMALRMTGRLAGPGDKVEAVYVDCEVAAAADGAAAEAVAVRERSEA